jgi:hypothetical protein
MLSPAQEPIAQQEPGHPKQFHQIEDQLARSPILPDTNWGFVIVRAVYGPSSDVAWAQMLELLRDTVSEELTEADHLELLSRHEITIIEDKATLAGADSFAARRAFLAWVAADLPRRLRKEYREENTTHPATDMPPRWRYCIFVDQECLRSLEVGPEDLEDKDPALKLLTIDFPEEAGVPTEEFTRDWEDGETNDDHENVGWMYIDMTDYVGKYSQFTSVFGWEEFYERPQKGYVDATR